VWREVVKDPDIENELRLLLERFAKERNSGERFGDFCERVILNEQKPALPAQPMQPLVAN
ncbi:MAG: hypothetical protein ACREC8_03810, partial [Limisphaerales bacterium]